MTGKRNGNPINNKDLKDNLKEQKNKTEELSNMNRKDIWENKMM